MAVCEFRESFVTSEGLMAKELHCPLVSRHLRLWEEISCVS